MTTTNTTSASADRAAENVIDFLAAQAGVSRAPKSNFVARADHPSLLPVGTKTTFASFLVNPDPQLGDRIDLVEGYVATPIQDDPDSQFILAVGRRAAFPVLNDAIEAAGIVPPAVVSEILPADWVAGDRSEAPKEYWVANEEDNLGGRTSSQHVFTRVI